MKKAIRTYTNLKMIRDVAYQFAGTAELLDDHEGAFFRTLSGHVNDLAPEKFFSVNIAHVVTLTFAIELYMKALNVKECSGYVATHDLRKLFDALDKKARERVVELTGRFQADFDVRLDAMKNAFVDFRYIHETHADNYPVGFAADLLHALQAILE